jgi:hypothetical protein
MAGLLGLLAGVALVLPSAPPTTLAGDDAPPSGDLEHNRRMLQLWRSDPEHWARLQQDLRAFAQLPAAQQERLRRLDRELYQLDPDQRKRLLRVLERYTLWLERLPAEDRAELEAARDTQERLARIRAIRQRQWLDRLPERTRAELERLPPEERSKRLVALVQREKRLQREWSRPRKVGPDQRQLKPARMEDFPPEVQTFVRDHLLPQLSGEEKKQLSQARGQWPELPRLLVQMTERHLSLPPLPGHPIRRYADLPYGAMRLLGQREELEKQPAWKKVEQKEGKWPDFALACNELLRAHVRTATSGSVPPLGASRPKEFAEPVQHFISKQLPAALSKEEAGRLHVAEGKWPEYPRLLLELAHKHQLHVPGMSLPDPRELWNNAH